MNLKIAQVIGLNTDQKAAQVVASSRNQESFLAVLDLSCDDAFTKGRQILSEIADFYFDFEGTAADKLKATFEEAQKKIESDEVSILLAAISGKILYLISTGGVAVYLKRSAKLSSLLSVGSPNQLISGFLEEADRLLFSTTSLISLLGDDLSQSISLPLEQFEEDISDRMGADERTQAGSALENQGLAALVVEIASADIPHLEQAEPAQDQTVPSWAESKKNLLLHLLQQIGSFLPKSGKGRLLIAAVIIAIIFLGVGFKVKVAKDAQREAAFKQVLQQAQDDFNAAEGLASLNPAEAKSKLDSAKDKLNQALSLKPENSDAKNLKNQIDQQSSSILLKSSVSDFPLFLDMDLVKKNFRASQFSLSNGKLLLLDPSVKTLVALDLAKKSHQILAGSEQLGDATTASLNGGLAFVYSQAKGVLRVDITSQKMTQVAKKDSDLLEIKDIYGFAGNVYLLDAGKNMIWKYLATSEGYSDKREYLSKNTKVDLANTVRMQIESSIYVLTKDGQMLRFTRGDKDNFSYGGLDKGVKDPKSFFVSSETDNLYLLDSGNSRLLILTKTGAYKGQISGEKFAQVADLVVDEKGKKAYLLDGSKIYQVDLK